MKRALIALATLATAGLTALTVAAPAGAATNTQVIHYKDTFAYAFWSTTRTTPAGTTVTDSNVQVSQSSQGSAGLYADQFISYYGADGTFLGAKETWGFSVGQISFSVNPGFLSASTSATGLVGGMETYDANWSVTSVDYNYAFGDASATWTGQGKITNTVYNDKYGSPREGITVIDHNQGLSRPAAATGTVAGLTFDAGDLVMGELGNVQTGQIVITVGR